MGRAKRDPPSAVRPFTHRDGRWVSSPDPSYGRRKTFELPPKPKPFVNSVPSVVIPKPTMRLTPQQIDTIRQIVSEQAGPEATVRLFGSRVDDNARGGDVDLLVELPHPAEDPAPLAARIAGRISRAMQGRKVDVVLAAPNLKSLPIHEIARREGVLL